MSNLLMSQLYGTGQHRYMRMPPLDSLVALQAEHSGGDVSLKTVYSTAACLRVGTAILATETSFLSLTYLKLRHPVNLPG